ncbi:hypothetical protein GPX89_37110 [Nocardia sp. ET3-3]|uniref:Uncharacterized protein n=1 Tax=Nocardia terrae TaxID=2675851 RepID=A0A7K1V8N2_9NOCA|nr:hypothetical protein [Nocardia terrae]MVU82842.1 hypothetical protein [Nocardia terrae]
MPDVGHRWRPASHHHPSPPRAWSLTGLASLPGSAAGTTAFAVSSTGLKVALLVVLSANFNTFVSNFLLFMIVWFAPWAAIYIIDYLAFSARPARKEEL